MQTWLNPFPRLSAARQSAAAVQIQPVGVDVGAQVALADDDSHAHFVGNGLDEALRILDAAQEVERLLEAAHEDDVPQWRRERFVPLVLQQRVEGIDAAGEERGRAARRPRRDERTRGRLDLGALHVRVPCVEDVPTRRR